MHTIYHDLPIQASPTAVFAAVSQPEQLINWWPQSCSGQAKEGEV